MGFKNKKYQIILQSVLKEKLNASLYIPSCTWEVTVNINFMAKLPEDNSKSNNKESLPKFTLQKAPCEVNC